MKSLKSAIPESNFMTAFFSGALPALSRRFPGQRLNYFVAKKKHEIHKETQRAKDIYLFVPFVALCVLRVSVNVPVIFLVNSPSSI